ncbi:27860_t:CDS:2 [Gigaspora margarita]|uniref:27860_t:CDS:1 n=1 Tax=Gigaspora margarita TaxID=4874 RepID=A0ABN7V5Y3_GIGMA|nr:27860_t:CDS:2 [Gigaspora margarita]
MLYVNVCISKEDKTLYRWYIHPIPYEMMLNEFFYKLVNREILPDISVNVSYFEQIKCIDLNKLTNLLIKTTQTSPNCKIIELTSEFGKNIHYHLHSNEMQYSNLDKYKNRFDIIIQTSQSKQLYIPNFSHSSNSNCKQLLCLDIVKLIQNHQSDMCNNTKLKERSFNIPPMFHEFLGRANPEAYKGARKQFDINELNIHYVTPLSLGIEVEEGIMDTIIRHNTMVPTAVIISVTANENAIRKGVKIA